MHKGGNLHAVKANTYKKEDQSLPSRFDHSKHFSLSQDDDMKLNNANRSTYLKGFNAIKPSRRH